MNVSPETITIAPENLIVVGKAVAFVLVAGIPIVSMVAVWILARFTSAFDAYAGERAKLKVQFDNVEKLVEQTGKITTATEGIKTQLSREEWGRQQRWLKRLECYANVIETLAAYNNAAITVHAQEGAISTLGVPENDPKEILTIRGEAIGPYNEAVSALAHATSMAELAAAEKPLVILRLFHLPSIDFSDTAGTILKGANLAATVSKAFVVAAREDLGYEALSKRPGTP